MDELSSIQQDDESSDLFPDIIDGDPDSFRFLIEIFSSPALFFLYQLKPLENQTYGPASIRS